jgi:hypothetical protein
MFVLFFSGNSGSKDIFFSVSSKKRSSRSSLVLLLAPVFLDYQVRVLKSRIWRWGDIF